MSESSIQLSVSPDPYTGSPVPPSVMESSFIPLSTIGTDLISVSNWNQDLRAEERQVDKGGGRPTQEDEGSTWASHDKDEEEVEGCSAIGKQFLSQVTQVISPSKRNVRDEGLGVGVPGKEI